MYISFVRMVNFRFRRLLQKCMYKNYSYFSVTEKHKNPTNVPILKKFHRVEHAQLAFENASKPTFFLHVTKIKILQVTGLRMLMIPFAWTSVDSTRVSSRKAFLKLFFPKNKIFSGQLLSFTVKDPCDQKVAKIKKETNKQTNKKEANLYRFAI